MAIPNYPTRHFRHRCFFVRKDSGLTSFEDLAGKRMATNGWGDTGNTWSRAILREKGVRIEDIQWYVGSVEGPPSGRPIGNLPPNVQVAPPGRSLRQLLLDGDIDALMCPPAAQRLLRAGQPVHRLVPDYRAAEQEYYRQTEDLSHSPHRGDAP